MKAILSFKFENNFHLVNYFFSLIMTKIIHIYFSCQASYKLSTQKTFKKFHNNFFLNIKQLHQNFKKNIETIFITSAS